MTFSQVLDFLRVRRDLTNLKFVVKVGGKSPSHGDRLGGDLFHAGAQHALPWQELIPDWQRRVGTAHQDTWIRLEFTGEGPGPE